MNKIFRRLTNLNHSTGKAKTPTDKLYYRIIVNGEYVTDYKLYDKETAEAEALKLGGKVDKTRLSALPND